MVFTVAQKQQQNTLSSFIFYQNHFKQKKIISGWVWSSTAKLQDKFHFSSSCQKHLATFWVCVMLAGKSTFREQNSSGHTT